MTAFDQQPQRQIGHFFRPSWKAIVLIAALATASGCYNNPRQAVEGDVTIDGAPLSTGQISFRPLPGTDGPSAGAEIHEGRFSIAREQGPFAGDHRVEITAWRSSGQTFHDSDLIGGEVELSEQYLPNKYNQDSELTATVEAGEPNQLQFNLQTQ